MDLPIISSGFETAKRVITDISKFFLYSTRNYVIVENEIVMLL